MRAGDAGPHQLRSALRAGRTWLYDLRPTLPSLRASFFFSAKWRDSTYLVGLGGGPNEVSPGRPSCPAVGEKAGETQAEGEEQGKPGRLAGGMACTRWGTGRGWQKDRADGACGACGGRAAGQPAGLDCRRWVQPGNIPWQGGGGGARRGPEHRQPQRGGPGAARPPHYRELWASILTAPEPTLTVAPEKKFP